jgi:hypothetical protein
MKGRQERSQSRRRLGLAVAQLAEPPSQPVQMVRLGLPLRGRRGLHQPQLRWGHGGRELLRVAEIGRPATGAVLSGCGFWRLSEAGLNRKDWSLARIKLVGIENRYEEVLYVLRGTRIKYFNSILAEKIDGASAAMHTVWEGQVSDQTCGVGCKASRLDHYHAGFRRGSTALPVVCEANGSYPTVSSLPSGRESVPAGMSADRVQMWRTLAGPDSTATQRCPSPASALP